MFQISMFHSSCFITSVPLFDSLIFIPHVCFHSSYPHISYSHIAYSHISYSHVSYSLTLQYIPPDMVPVAYPNLPRPPTHRQSCVNAFVYVHQTLYQANTRLAKRGGATMTVTPRHYLDFISHYVRLSRHTHTHTFKSFIFVSPLSFLLCLPPLVSFSSLYLYPCIFFSFK